QPQPYRPHGSGYVQCDLSVLCVHQTSTDTRDIAPSKRTSWRSKMSGAAAQPRG
ncbi:hypothetical protein M404DRAFT_960824, partial [Pisolithus tinctorius Marx 270]